MNPYLGVQPSSRSARLMSYHSWIGPHGAVPAASSSCGASGQFFGPLLYLNDPDSFTVAVALATKVSRVGTEWNLLMAANLIAVIPPLTVYFLAQKKLIGGIASVGIRG